MATPARRANRALKPRRRSPLPKTVSGRRWLTAVVVLLASGGAGWFTSCLIYPRPVFGDDHSVARVVGMPISAAESVLAQQGFKVKVEGEAADPEIPAGAVVWQDPPPDLIAPAGTTVELIRSSGPASVPVPDLAGMDLPTALRILSAAGLRPGAIDSVPSTEDPDVVLSTRPASGSANAPGSSVDLVVSEGSRGIEVPNVVGLRRDEARRQIEAAGFRIGRINRAAGRRGPPDTVIEQRPAAGAVGSRRSRVDLTVTEVN